MNRHPFAVLAFSVLLLAAGPAGTLTDPPRSRDARDALERLDGAKKRAQAEYDAAVKKATSEAVKALEKAKADVMRDGGLDEANRIQTAIDQITDRATPAPLAKQIAGTKWKFGGRGIPVEYFANGTIKCPAWKPSGIGRWRVVGSSTIEQIEPNGTTAMVTFDPTGQAAVWVYPQGGNANYAVKANK
jgi:hypothetical protein